MSHNSIWLDDMKTLNAPFNIRLPRVLFKKIKANIYNKDRDFDNNFFFFFYNKYTPIFFSFILLSLSFLLSFFRGSFICYVILRLWEKCNSTFIVFLSYVLYLCQKKKVMFFIIYAKLYFFFYILLIRKNLMVVRWPFKTKLHPQSIKTFRVATRIKTLIDLTILNVVIDCVCKVVLDHQPPTLNSLIMVLILYYSFKIKIY